MRLLAPLWRAMSLGRAVLSRRTVPDLRTVVCGALGLVLALAAIYKFAHLGTFIRSSMSLVTPSVHEDVTLYLAGSLPVFELGAAVCLVVPR